MDCPVVETSLGKVKGRLLPKAKCEEAKQVFLYLGIPFAKPPLGELRFERPQKAEAWDGTFNATKHPGGPMQDETFLKSLDPSFTSMNIAGEDHYKFNEDCLYLNIYTSSPNKSKKMPVMVWFYGGGMAMGSLTGYHGQVICGLQDVVIVIPNYRVNAFGFLSAGNTTKWRGNYGLFDQRMALEWVRDNIEGFGGDPKNVTIFGESAGSLSVSMHVLSPLSRGLFHRAISHSGTAGISSAGCKLDMEKDFRTLLEELKITEVEPELAMKKLKEVPAKDIITAQGKMILKASYFTIGIDGDFLPKKPEELMDGGDFAPVPYMIGFNNTEGAGILSGMHTFDKHLDPDKEAKIYDEESGKAAATGTLIQYSLFSNEEERKNAVERAAELYMKKYNADDKYKWNRFVADVLGDTFFGINSIEQALAHSGAGHPTFLYYMTHTTRFAHEDEFGKNTKKKPVFCQADHGDDIYFTFGFPFVNGKSSMEIKFDEEENQMCRDWIAYLANFARTGNPSGRGLPAEWPKYDGKERKHLVFDSPFSVGEKVLENEHKFWVSLLKA